jgi:plasmid stabilization system protein ParE
MTVRYSPRAFTDREAIYDCLKKISLQRARNVKLAVVRAIRSLARIRVWATPKSYAGVDRTCGSLLDAGKPLRLLPGAKFDIVVVWRESAGSLKTARSNGIEFDFGHRR